MGVLSQTGRVVEREQFGDGGDDHCVVVKRSVFVLVEG
jgi:hypothetical protein